MQTPTTTPAVRDRETEATEQTRRALAGLLEDLATSRYVRADVRTQAHLTLHALERGQHGHILRRLREGRGTVIIGPIVIRARVRAGLVWLEAPSTVAPPTRAAV